jgi:hypothetical protein
MRQQYGERVTCNYQSLNRVEADRKQYEALKAEVKRLEKLYKVKRLEINFKERDHTK